jgi:ribosome recycling factor
MGVAEEILADLHGRIAKTLESLRSDLSTVRTGRASLHMLDGVRVDYYGTPTPLNQVATLSVPEARLILVKPWEKNLIPVIDKAIRDANLGYNPQSDKDLVRIPIPPLTEERRKELSRHVHKLAEEGRNSVRQVRRETNDRLKKLLKDKLVSEDDERKGLDEVQKITDQHISHIDDLQKKKDVELLGK